MLNYKPTPCKVATKAVRLAKSLAARGCTVVKFRVSSFGSCYIAARLSGVKFCIRVADHYGRTAAPNGNLYYVRVDDPAKGTRIPLGEFVTRLCVSDRGE